MYLVTVRWITGTELYHVLLYNDVALATELGNLVTKNYIYIDIYQNNGQTFAHKLRMEKKQ